MPDPSHPSVPDVFAPYRVDHLLMLVGGNPLPNAVAAPLLTRPGARITLLHSLETYAVAGRIAQSLDDRHGLSTKLVEIDVSDRADITTKIELILASEKGEVGLHYTGGTKAMAVHAFRAVEDFARQKRRNAIFSYLDARKLALMIDPYRDEHFQARPLQVPIGETNFPLRKMLALHNWEVLPNTPLRTERFLPATTEAIARVNVGNHFGKWLEWKNQFVDLAKVTRKEGNWHVVDWQAVTIPLPTDPALAGVRQALIEELKLTGDTLDTESARRSLSVSLPFFSEYLEAKWMEALTLSALIDCKPEFGLKDVYQSLKPHDRSDRKVHFELDCVARHGYQLFAVSCTLDWNTVANQHLFEVYVRARQIGGDEARLALVCLTQDAPLMQKKVRRDLDAGSRIRVFGRRDLLHLPERFHEWIEAASRGDDSAEEEEGGAA